MKWFIEEITRLIDQLKRWQTWAAIVLIGIFASLAFSVGSFAFRTDGILLYLNRTAGACRELSNGIIIFMFCGMIFFMLTALLTLGEFQQYLNTSNALLTTKPVARFLGNRLGRCSHLHSGGSPCYLQSILPLD